MSSAYGPQGPRFAGLGLQGGSGNDPSAQFGVQVLGTPSGQPGSASNQERTFALLERITAMFRAFRFPQGYVPADTDPTTLDSGVSSATSNVADWQEFFKADNQRLQVYEDVDEMDETSDEIAAALDTLADSSVNPEDGSEKTFMIEIKEGPYRDLAEQVFTQVTESLDLQSSAFTIARNALKYGDCFLELVVDETGRLARSKILPVKTIYRNEDHSGNLVMGTPNYDAKGRCINQPSECAFDQREQMNAKLLAAFEPWQITHFRWNRRGNDRYGHSLLRTARLTWKKLKACEEAIVVARLQRAWMRLVHNVDTTGMNAEEAEAALRKYKTGIQRRIILDTQSREAPFDVTSDYFISSGYIRNLDGATYLERKSRIEVLPGDHNALHVMTDIEYFQNKLFSSLRVPKAYLGIERDINAKATLTTQDIQFARMLRRIQNMLSTGYKEIFDFALVLAGIDPLEVNYVIRWPVILVSDEERDAVIRRMHAEADGVYWQMGAPSTKYLVQQRFGMDDEQWLADLQDAQFDPPARLKTIPRMPREVDGTGAQSPQDALDGILSIDSANDVNIAPVDNLPSSRTPTDQPQMANPNGAGVPPLGGLGEEDEADVDDQGLAHYGYYRPRDVELDSDSDGDGDLIGTAGPQRIPNAKRVLANERARAYSVRRGMLTIPGVHSLSPRATEPLTRASRVASVAEVQRTAQETLDRFIVDLYGRKHQNAERLAVRRAGRETARSAK